VGAWLRRFTQFIVDEADAQGRSPAVDFESSPFSSPIVRARLADAITYGLLQGQPNNFSTRLSATRAAEPKYVREAAEYLEAHAAHPIQLADLARVTGVGVRALQLGFQKHRGTHAAGLPQRATPAARADESPRRCCADGDTSRARMRVRA